jgi:hypothetical protein
MGIFACPRASLRQRGEADAPAARLCNGPQAGARRAERALDVHPRVAMQILRHSRVAITMEIYTEVPSAATREALRRLGQWLEDAQT